MDCCVHRRCRELFEQAAREGIELPSVTRGNIMLTGARLGRQRRASVLAVAGQSQVETFFAQALRATFPRLVAATPGVAQFVVDPDRTLESDEVPVTTSTNKGNMDATKADLRLLANASEEVTTIDEKKRTGLKHVKKARAPMNPKIACSCMRQLWDPEPKGMGHTEPPSVGSSTMDMVQNSLSGCHESSTSHRRHASPDHDPRCGQ